MCQEGHGPAVVDGFFSGNYVSADAAAPAAPAAPRPPMGGGGGGGLLAGIQGGMKLKKASAAPPRPSPPGGGGGGGLLDAIKGGIKLKKAAPVQHAEPSSSGGGLLDAIKGGVKLKKAAARHEIAAPAPKTGGGGMMGDLLAAMAKRSTAIREDESDSDSDSDNDFS